MRLDAFRDGALVNVLAERTISMLDGRTFRFMEVCGTHTTAAFRYGLHSRLGKMVELLSGPGCPVCVTPASFIDRAVMTAELHGAALVTFGDMMRVPGSDTNLEESRARGTAVEVVYSPTDALELAARMKDTPVIFLAVGFETTVPAIAAAVLEAERNSVDNFFLLCAAKRIPPALDFLSADPELAIDGFMCPGHVSVITGTRAYEELSTRRGLPCVITGFEPLDMITGIHLLVKQCLEGRSVIEIAYTRAVKPDGNRRARELMSLVFDETETEWRGLGRLPSSGYRLRPEYEHRDAALRFPVDVGDGRDRPGCMCGDVLKGKRVPGDCGLFGLTCTPETPEGPCMVSSEGTCAAHYRYGRDR